MLRGHRDTLLSVLETLVHDPLVEWAPKNPKGGAEEQENAMARDAMATIEGDCPHTTLSVLLYHLHFNGDHIIITFVAITCECGCYMIFVKESTPVPLLAWPWGDQHITHDCYIYIYISNTIVYYIILYYIILYHILLYHTILY